MIKLVLCNNSETIETGLLGFINEFKEKHTSFENWCYSKKNEFSTGKRQIFQIINENQNIVGHVMLNYVNDKDAKLNAIYISEAARGRKYAQETFETVCEMLKKKGTQNLFIQTREYNKKVLHIFEKLRF